MVPSVRRGLCDEGGLPSAQQSHVAVPPFAVAVLDHEEHGPNACGERGVQDVEIAPFEVGKVQVDPRAARQYRRRRPGLDARAQRVERREAPNRNRLRTHR